MKYNVQNIDISYIANEWTLRTDVNYIVSDINVSRDDYYRFDDLFDIVSDDKVDIEKLYVFKYAEISDVTSEGDVYPVQLDIDERNELNDNYFKKIEKGDIIYAKKNDILIAKVRPYLKKIIFIDDTNCDIYYTSAFIHLRPKNNPLLLYYLLKCHFIDNLNSISRQGKGYPTLNERDLKFLKFEKKYIDEIFAKEKQLLEQIIPRRNVIYELKQKKVNDRAIVDDILGRYFKWDYNTFAKEKEIGTFFSDFRSIANNYDIRVSAKFHRPAGKFVYEDIKKNRWLKIKNFLSEPIVLGASVTPSDFNPSGEYYYISMASVKNYKVELDDSQLLSDEYAGLPNKTKKRIKNGDIIMTRSGAAIGKFALVEEDIKAIHSDFTMRIRLSNINLRFAYYYFRSSYFQYLIEINYKGLQNNNIFPNQVQELPIPDIDIIEQNKIVKNIMTQLDKQNEYKDQILHQNNMIETLFK